MSDLNQPNNQQTEDLETGLKILSLCIPLAGLILYFINKDKAPKKAKAACNFALIGIGISLVLQIIVFVMGGMSA